MASLKYFTRDAKTASGVSLPLSTAYTTYGDVSSPAIHVSACFGGLIESTLTAFIGKGKVLDPAHYFIVLTGLFGAGESSSPSNQKPPFHGSAFPVLSYADNVHNIKALLDSLGVKHLRAVVGFSMGGQVAWHFCHLYPDFIDGAVILCSLAETTTYNKLFHDSLINAVRSSADYRDGNPTEEGDRRLRKLFGGIYAPYCMGGEWFNTQQYRKQGHASLEDFLAANWSFAAGEHHHINNLLAMLATWRLATIASYHPSGDLEQAIASTQPRMLLMPGSRDTYFRPEDSEREFAFLPKHKGHQHIVIDSIQGHSAGSGNSTERDNAFVVGHMEHFLAGL